ncbi:calmodulin-like 3 [Terramyces sp. JEL0728]|nr:calmodulin-like 3 [Terramyces sp. JEL0728]
MSLTKPRPSSHALKKERPDGGLGAVHETNTKPFRPSLLRQAETAGNSDSRPNSGRISLLRQSVTSRGRSSVAKEDTSRFSLPLLEEPVRLSQWSMQPPGRKKSILQDYERGYEPLRKDSLIEDIAAIRFALGTNTDGSSVTQGKNFKNHPIPNLDNDEEPRHSFTFSEFIQGLKKKNLNNKMGGINIRKRNPVKELRDKLSHVNLFPGLSKEECDYYIEAFCAFDLDSNGSISENELQAAMEGIGMDITLEQSKLMIKEVDQDGNGDVSIEEFIKIMVRYRQNKKFLQTDADINEAFTICDTDNDGSIGINDLMALFEEIG